MLDLQQAVEKLMDFLELVVPRRQAIPNECIVAIGVGAELVEKRLVCAPVEPARSRFIHYSDPGLTKQEQTNDIGTNRQYC